jgi:hypothetical protein
MRRGFVFLTAVICFMFLGTGAMAQEKKKGEAAPPAKGAPAEKKPAVAKEKVTTVKATVEAIDLPNRVVTLKGPKGNVFDLKVGEQAKNLPQVKVGDEVVAKYYESIALKVMPPGPAEGVKKSEAVVAAKPGESPAGMVANQVTVTATVEAIDPKKTFVTLKGPQGKVVDVKVRDPKNLENVKPGDQVVITYTEALAISVEKPKSAPKPPKK